MPDNKSFDKPLKPEEVEKRNNKFWSIEKKMVFAINHINDMLIYNFHKLNFNRNETIKTPLFLCTIEISHSVSTKNKNHKDFINFLARHIFPLFRKVGWKIDFTSCKSCSFPDVWKKEGCTKVKIYPKEKIEKERSTIYDMMIIE